MIIPSFQVQADGTLTKDARRICANIIASFAGKQIAITFAEKKEKRSLDQNSYYRAGVLPHFRKMMFDLGDARSLDEWHETILATFAPIVEVSRMNGDAALLPKRTHQMAVSEMAEFITAVTVYAANMGYPVPLRENAA